MSIHFQHLADPRTGRRKEHNLVAMITIGILAVLCGADGFVALETYGKANQAWLETFLDLPFGIPSHDTFGRVFGMLDLTFPVKSEIPAQREAGGRWQEAGGRRQEEIQGRREEEEFGVDFSPFC